MPAFLSACSPLVTAHNPPAIDHSRRNRGQTLLCLLPALMLFACSRGNDAPKPPPMNIPEVTVVKVARGDIAQGYEYVGQTAGSRETEVRARVAGIIEKRLYEEGSRVVAGTPLFQIDQGAFRTQLAAAEAVSAVTQVRLNQAQREMNRLAPLAAEKAISQKEFDDAKSNLEILQATLKQNQAQVNEASLNLGYTRVLAPISGITGIATKAEGSMVTTTDSLLTTLVQTDPMFVQFSVTEADYLKLNSELASGKVKLSGKRAGNGSLAFAVTLKLADGSTYPLPGKMNFASEKINPANGGFDARAEIPNPQGLLRPGQFVRVLLGGASRANAISVPQRAVVDGPSGKLVMLVGDDNKVQPRPVELDGWTHGQWIVTKGLQGGERVLVDGVKARKPGTVVKPVELQAVADPAGAQAKPDGMASHPGASAAPAMSAASKMASSAAMAAPATSGKAAMPSASAMSAGK